jgi:hypothetical protein
MIRLFSLFIAAYILIGCGTDTIIDRAPIRDKIEYLCSGYCLRAANCGGLTWGNVEQRQECQTTCITSMCSNVNCKETYLGLDETIDACYVLLVFKSCNVQGMPLPCLGIFDD